MLNINLVYIYPKTIEINNEINLLRIIDKKLKESLVFYCVKEDDRYNVCVINTMTGENTNIINYNGKSNIDALIDNIKTIETEIKNLESLEAIEKYILKIIQD